MRFAYPFPARAAVYAGSSGSSPSTRKSTKALQTRDKNLEPVSEVNN